MRVTDVLVEPDFEFRRSMGAVFGSATVASASLVSNEVNVYFQIDGNGSQWVTKVHAENREVDEIARDIYKWSNEIYKEKYENNCYIEYRPLTPLMQIKNE